ncbi:hypothetical protein [Thalassotalea atypica]|uniref:hypothetical protein n=1 Tax=Thalassotalea atypica TaxID=2054316 RepID=UPI002573AC45|nr:hypothetical protein [Thalassotalea atypica]
MKKLITLIPCLIASYTASAAEVDFAQMSKQLNIMENIISSSVGTGSKHRGSKLSGIESTYLKGQGIVFTIRSSGGRGHWGSYNFNIPVPAVPPVPPVGDFTISDHNMAQLEHASALAGVDIEQTVAEAMESAAESYEHALESLSENRDQYRELRDEQRDLSYELRDIARETRDLEYQLKRAEPADQKEIKAELQTLAKKKEKLNVSRKEMDQRTKEYKQKQSAQQAKREEERKGYYSKLSKTMAETLCLYGNGLKSLPKGENVTVILKSGGDKVGRQYQDIIHVFSKRNINGCATDEISADKLLASSNAYQF